MQTAYNPKNDGWPNSRWCSFGGNKCNDANIRLDLSFAQEKDKDREKKGKEYTKVKQS